MASLDSPQAFTANLTHNLTDTLPRTTLRLYQALHAVAIEVLKHRGYHPKTSQVTFHCPAEIVAHALGLHRDTVRVHVATLKAHGLLDARGHYGTLRGSTRADGTLWAVNCPAPWKGSTALLRGIEALFLARLGRRYRSGANGLERNPSVK